MQNKLLTLQKQFQSLQSSKRIKLLTFCCVENSNFGGLNQAFARAFAQARVIALLRRKGCLIILCLITNCSTFEHKLVFKMGMFKFPKPNRSLIYAGISRPTVPPPFVDYNETHGYVGEVSYPGFIIGGCAGTRYGCCLDGKRAAEGPDSQGCPEGKRLACPPVFLIFLFCGNGIYNLGLK